MNRRAVLKYFGASGSVAFLGSGVFWLTRSREHSELAVNLVLERLRNLNPQAIETSGKWGTARTFEHLAQSIEFSITGFPVMKSKAFQNTAGQLAYSVFQARGQMSHGLDEVIPGEIVASPTSTPAEGLHRLIKALAQFELFNGELQPHFAYGALDKQQYAVAHVLHINNHFEEFRPVKINMSQRPALV